MRKKRLLILGGPAQCKKVVEAAHELGVYVIVMDISPNAKTSKEADETVVISLCDYEGILEWCKKNPVDGIINYCVDIAQRTYQKLCDALGMPCFGNKEQYQTLTDKKLFKELCIRNGVDVIPDYSVNEVLSGNADFPVLVKPTQSSGSRGASICHNVAEVKAAVEKAKGVSLDGKIIIEKYMEGKQDFTVTYIISNGVPVLVRIGDRYTGKKEDGLNRQCICCVCPSKFTVNYLNNVDEKVKHMLKSLGIQNGPVFFQGFIDGDTIRFYDPGFRFSGGDYERLYKKANGIDIVQETLRFALGSGSVKNIATDGYLLNGMTTIQLAVTARAGKIVVFEGMENICDIPQVVYFAQRAFVGDEIPQSGDIKQRVAQIGLLVDSNPEIIKSAIKTVYEKLRIEDENGDMLVSKFSY